MRTLYSIVTNHQFRARSLPRALLRVSIVCLLPGLGATSCLPENTAQCGTEQGLVDGACVCPEGYLIRGEECVACGPNEVVQGKQCVCAPGYERDKKDRCQLVAVPAPPPGTSSAPPCDGGDCGAPTADAADDATACVDTEDCPGNAYCDLTVTPAACREPPTGQGTTCASDADCAGFEASYCETVVSRTCLVSNCSPSLNNCSDDFLCCDFASMGLPSLCVSKALSGGVCM